MGVTQGIRYDAIDRMVTGEEPVPRVLVAAGTMPKDGQDGHYEYFFRTSVARTPKTLEDGNVDFRSVEWFELVKKGQKLAYYHSATPGKNGMTVTGKVIPARKGREQSILTGKGFHRLPDGKTYVADLDGIVTLSDTKMEVTDLLVTDEVTLATGDINFDGNVFVSGNVGSGVKICAQGDILIGGFVESAHIEAGGSVMIRQGMNASGEGVVRAKGDINGYFFEAVEIDAGANIHGDYFMNCTIHAQGMVNVMGKKGMLVGGRTCAEEGIKVNQLGNQAGLKTYIKLGMSERLRKRELAVTESIHGVQGELETLNHAHEDLVKKYPSQIRNSMELYLKIESAIYTKEQQMRDLMIELGQIEEEKTKVRTVSAVVENHLYDGVIIEIDGVRWKSRRLGSVRIKKSENKIMVFSNR